MVFDFGKDPQKQQREEQLRQARLRAQNQTNNKPKVLPKKIAQAIPIPRAPIPIPLPNLPEYPWVTPQDIERIQNYMFKGKNPLTGEPIQTQDEQKVFKILTPAQIKGLKKSKYKEDLRYANDSLTNDKSCAVIGLNISNGYEPKAMMTTALTGANNASLVVTPAGNTALFDGLYKGKTKADQKRPGGGYAYEVEPISPPMNTAEEVKAQNFIRSKSAEWERQGTIARECGYTMRVAIPDEDLVHWTNKSLFTTPPSFQVIEAKLGGTYGQVRANTVGGQVHHMPADSVNGLSTSQGPAIWMYILDHQRTLSHDTSGKSKAEAYRNLQKKLIESGQFRKAMQLDINNIRSIAPGIYDISIQQMLKKYNKVNP